MPLHNLVSRYIINKLGTANRTGGETPVIERVPSSEEVDQFLVHLQSLSDRPISERFKFSPRDGTIAVSHKVPRTADDPERNYYVSLLTVTQDYTWRCKDTFKKGWKKPVETNPGRFAPGNVHALLPEVLHRMDPMQLALLNRTDFPAYLHIIRKDELSVPGRMLSDIIYTVEVAYRYRSEHEPDVGRVVLSSWRGMSNYARRRATPDEVTMWAVLNLVPTDGTMDDTRLNIIRSAISAVTPSLNDSVEPPLVNVQRGNMYHLLRSRNNSSMDGRARYPVIRSVVLDEGKIQSSRALTDIDSDDFHIKEHADLPTTVSNILTIMQVVAADVLFGCLGLLYLLRLQDDDVDVDAVIGVAFGAMGAFMLPSLPFWIKLFTGNFSPAGVMSRHRPITARELHKLAVSVGPRALVESCSTDVATEAYNGDWLNFNGLAYVGSHDMTEKGGRLFSVNDLLQSGYQMGFAMDGRETLIVPHPHPALLRLRGIDRNGRAVFEHAQVMPQLTKIDESNQGMIEVSVVPIVRGRWRGNIDIGREKDMHHGV